ncbi:MAG: hypothetical protein HZC40_01165 [Chloroflexi bacterium]|nr:hypothetical protein [Chloroflexota bacterium]
MPPIKFEHAQFGSIVANGVRYDYDLILTAAGEIRARPKHLSKKYGGWHTILGPEEIKFALAGAPKIVLIATGHFGVLPIHAQTRALIAQLGIVLECARIHRALARYDELARAGKRVAMILHLTC